MFRERIKKFHFVGIGGIGMSGIAQILLEMGYQVSGSDLQENKNVRLLREKGVTAYIGHREENLKDADVVVYSSAVDENNPELRKAKQMSIPTIPRGEMLAELFRLKEGIAVCGSHGKTTTTSMIAHISHMAGMDPTVIIGGILQSLGTNAKLGRDNLIISEADESDGSFLKLSPTVAVITNIDKEHLGFYRDLEEIKEAFIKFANSVPFYGFCVMNMDDENSASTLPYIKKKVLTFGIEKKANLQASNLRLIDGKYSFDVELNGQRLGNIYLGVPGRHNVYNALASTLVCLNMDISFDTISSALASFRNAERRLDLKGYYKGNPIYDDYGHHPTEIKSVLSAIREMYPDRRVILIFQPHRYSRTFYLYNEFIKVLKEADVKITTHIYPAGEENTYGVNGQDLAKDSGAIFAADKEEIFELLEKESTEGDVILFMGAGSISRWCEEFVNLVKS